MWTEQLQPRRDAEVRVRKEGCDATSATLPPQGGEVLRVQLPDPSLRRVIMVRIFEMMNTAS
jgi:hypothetical protein